MNIFHRRVTNILLRRRCPSSRSSLSLSSSSFRHRPDENRTKKTNSSSNYRRLFQPIDVKPMIKSPMQSNIGEELTGGKTFDRSSSLINHRSSTFDSFVCIDVLLRILTDFYRRDEVKTLSSSNGIDLRLFQDAYVSFRKYCIQSNVLPVDLHIIFNDIVNGAGHVTDLFPYFLRHAREMYPHLTCLDDLKKISDLRDPANWYPDARSIRRKIIFHAGPTNSGKVRFSSSRLLLLFER